MKFGLKERAGVTGRLAGMMVVTGGCGGVTEETFFDGADAFVGEYGDGENSENGGEKGGQVGGE